MADLEFPEWNKGIGKAADDGLNAEYQFWNALLASNSIIAAGRADLCAIARPHLADPAWTLHQAALLQFDPHSQTVAWPAPYLAGRDQLYREVARHQALAAQTTFIHASPDPEQ